MTVGVFLSAHLSSFTYLFVPAEDPVNSKWILFTAGMVGDDYSGFSTLYIFVIDEWLSDNIYKGKTKFKMDCDSIHNSILRCEGKFRKWFHPDRNIQQRNRYPLVPEHIVPEHIVLSFTSHLQEYS